jgi:hypothetical protein
MQQHIQPAKARPATSGPAAEHQANTDFFERARRVVASLGEGKVIYAKEGLRGGCQVLAFAEHGLVVKIVNEAEVKRTENAFSVLSDAGYSPPRALFLPATSEHVALIVMEQIPRDQIAGARRLYFAEPHGQRMKELVWEGIKIVEDAGLRSDQWIPDYGSNMAITPDAEQAAIRGQLTRSHLIPFDPVF